MITGENVSCVYVWINTHAASMLLCSCHITRTVPDMYVSIIIYRWEYYAIAILLYSKIKSDWWHSLTEPLAQGYQYIEKHEIVQ